MERAFLNAGHDPEKLERDEFDRYSVHVGVINRGRELLAASRLIQVSMCGLPLFRHCQIFPNETELYRETNRIVEVSRLCVSRELRQRGEGSGQGRAAIVAALYRELYQASKRAGFTHWLVATENSLQRLVTGFGFPFRAVGPLTDYFGPVAPFLMDLRAFDQVILSGTRPALSSFLDGLEPEIPPDRPQGRPVDRWRLRCRPSGFLPRFSVRHSFPRTAAFSTRAASIRQRSWMATRSRPAVRSSPSRTRSTAFRSISSVWPAR